MWTDLDRAVVEYAKANPDATFYQGRDLASVRSELAWAKTNDISLLNWREVFNRMNVSPLVKELLVAYAQQQGPGYAGFSDVLREVVHWFFGGLYADGDTRFGAQLMADLVAVLRSRLGYTLKTVRVDEFGEETPDGEFITLVNPIIIGPARHAIGR